MTVEREYVAYECNCPVPKAATSLDRLKTIVGFTASLLTAALIIVFSSLVTWETCHNRIELQQIVVPKSLTDVGYNGEILTRRLRDYIVDSQAYGPPGFREVTDLNDTPEIKIPGADISVSSAADYLKQYLPDNWRHDVSGEVNPQGSRLLLRIRLNGEIIFQDTQEITASNASLLKRAALSVLEMSLRSELAAFPSKVANHINLAQILQSEGRNDDTRAECEEALKLDRRNVSAHTILGAMYISTNNERQAEAELNAALAINKKWVPALVDLGHLLRDNKKYDDAIKQYRYAIEIDPKFAPAYIGLGNALLYGPHQEKEATEAYRNAILYTPTEARAYFDLGIALESEQKYEDAISEMQVAIELDPDHAPFRSRIADELMNLAASSSSPDVSMQFLLRACEEEIAAHKIDPSLSDVSSKEKLIDAKMADRGHCPS